MKTILATRTVEIPEGVEVSVKARVVTVKGKLGELVRDFKHMPMELRVVKGAEIADESAAPEGEEQDIADKDFVKVDLWFANRKQLACVRTVCSHIENMIVGVTRGFIYKLRFVYSHFPINVTLNGNNIEIRNFVGERRVRKVKLLDGVKYIRSDDVKDEIQLQGIDITKVSLNAAQIQQNTNIRNKDLRKFLDGIYVSEKGPAPEV
eukprot:CAMPEP_0170271134 /NCGR_PEP_ID=MMETSP0116_2-20130129/35514_1 /TAXON_ID=400756 /ORGANISM="Durinskia baltica, Strain CSIRO CS-38" /LENGTH=206 /DNA_ID=CAMNT_0010522331 /DNA_START=92 /DNA_END=712 /DNA_ORIENTATION=-